MHALLEKIFETGSFTTSQDQTVKIHSETKRDQCAFLQKLVADNNFSRSLEIGFAYGISALAITEQIARNNGKHVLIDKFEHKNWKSVGLDLIEQAGLTNNTEFYEQYCYEVLPELLKAKRTFDFVYIDSTKQLDWLLVDFFYIDKMLSVNGIIVFDDASFPGITKLLRYVSQYPHYRVYGTYPENRKNKILSRFLPALKLLPRSDKYIRPEVRKTNYQLGINAHCVALQKTGEDTRNWDWHKDF